MITRPFSVVLGGVINGAQSTLNLPVGTAQDDYGVVFGGHPYSGGAAQDPTSAGWTRASLTGGSAGAANPWLGCWYKKMPSTPDSSVVMPGGGAAADSSVYQLWVLRGVDPNTPLDVPPQTSGSVDPPPITTVTPEAWVFAAAAVGQNDNSVVALSGYTDFTRHNVNDTRPTTVAVCRKELAVPATEDPPAYSDLGTSPVLPQALTIAFRPAGASAPADTSKFFQFL